mgnify:CR=1 FL=1
MTSVAIATTALTKKFGASRIGFEKWKSNNIESRRDPTIADMRVESRIDAIRNQYNAHAVVKKYNVVQDATSRKVTLSDAVFGHEPNAFKVASTA